MMSDVWLDSLVTQSGWDDSSLYFGKSEIRRLVIIRLSHIITEKYIKKYKKKMEKREIFIFVANLYRSLEDIKTQNILDKNALFEKVI